MRLHSAPLSFLLFPLSLILLLSLAPTPVHSKSFLAFIDSSMGFGDKIKFYRNILAFAHALNRSAVLPPFQITVRDYSPIEHADLQKDGEDAITEALRRYTKREGHVTSFDLPASVEWFEVDEWFNLSRITAVTGVPVETMRDWNARVSSTVDLAIVADTPHGCSPSWASECRTNRKQRNVRIERAGYPLVAARLWCDSTHGKHVGQDFDLPENFGDLFLERLKHNNLQPPETLFVDGVCFSHKRNPLGLESLFDLARRAFFFSDGVQAKADAFLKEKGIRRYIAIHWRRSDVVVDHGSYFRSHTPEAVVLGIKRSLYPLISDPRRIDSVVLITDNFMLPELARFKTLVKDELHLPVYRYGADDSLALLPGSARARGEHVVMDLALATRADYFGNTGGGSFFSLFINHQRTAYGHVASTSTPLDMREQRDEL